MEFNITAELKKLPMLPGVYIMHDEHDEIIYVGKAVNLKRRVRQYFDNSRKHGPKIEKMVGHIKYFEYIITDSEIEALVLECNLIKEHSPRYNTLLKDDKNYPYIKVTVNEEFPRILFARQVKKDKAKYFGPFTSAASVNDTIELITEIFKIRTCSQKIEQAPERHSADVPSERQHVKGDLGRTSGTAKKMTGHAGKRACLNFHIGRCAAPCQGYISAAEYAENVSKALNFLKGNQEPVIKMLEEKMNRASEQLEFEEAAKYRDLIASVRHTSSRQKINDAGLDDRDVIACAFAKRELSDIWDIVVSVFYIREGKMLGRENFHMTSEETADRKEILSDFIKQYYSGTPFIPPRILLQDETEDIELLTGWLKLRRNGAVSIQTPKKGQKEKLVELAYENAKMVLDKDMDKLFKEDRKINEALETLKRITGLEKLSRIESYDISNISGYNSVGSMVVYENGRPKKNDYRKFRIRSVDGPNDYASLHEVITRRFSHGLKEKEEHSAATGKNNEEKLSAAAGEKEIEETSDSFARFPDVIFMDGGKGQISAAQAALDELGIAIPVLGMVKDDTHSTRGLILDNEILPIDTHSEAFRLITRIQDETHRFAIEYHQSLRSKEQVHSVLDDIPSVGPVRRRALMKHFSSLEELSRATVEELKKIPEINEASAKQIVDFFNK